jgi:hypothetical protein
MAKVFGWLESAGEKVLHVALGNGKDKGHGIEPWPLP